MEFYDWGTKESPHGRDIEIKGLTTNLSAEIPKVAKLFAVEAEETATAMIDGNDEPEEEPREPRPDRGTRESAISLTRASLTRACLPPAIAVEEIAPAEKKFTVEEIAPAEKKFTTTAREDTERAPPLATMGQRKMMMATARDDDERQMAEANPTNPMTRRRRGNFLSKFFNSRGKKETNTNNNGLSLSDVMSAAESAASDGAKGCCC